MKAQSRRQPVRVELGKRSAWLSGPGVHAALMTAGAPKMWCHRRRCWSCSVGRVHDVVAILEHQQGRRVELVEVLP